MKQFFGMNNKKYTLGKFKGKGAEGSVYELVGESDIVAKIYHDTKIKNEKDHEELDQKLQTMVNMKITPYVDGVLRFAWPLDVLYSDGKMVGFVMPAIKEKTRIFDVERTSRTCPKAPWEQRVCTMFPNFNYKFKVQIAYQLAYLFDYLHRNNIIIGDLNPNNFYVNKNGPIFIDCDSYTIITKNRVFPCTVGFPEMLPPELQIKGSFRGKFTVESDNFGLAVRIFRLLMRNQDPFGGIPTSNHSTSTLTELNYNIIKGNCPYVRKSEITVKKDSPTLDILPQTIQNCFNKTFNYTPMTAIKKTTIQNRTTALEWCKALLPLAEKEPNPNYKKCRKNKYHVYPKQNCSCPWCALENGTYQQQPIRKPQTTRQAQTTNQKVIHKPTIQTHTVQKQNNPVSLFYGMLISFGLIGAYLFSGSLRSVLLEIGIMIPTMYSVGILALIDMVIVWILANKFTDNYKRADSMWLYLIGTVFMLIVPLLVVLILAMIINIIG